MNRANVILVALILSLSACAGRTKTVVCSVTYTCVGNAPTCPLTAINECVEIP